MARLVFLGPPGAGKGTQAESLKEAHGLEHLSTGDLLRSAVSAGTELGNEAKKYMDAGDLVPDEVVVGMIRERLEDGAAAAFLLDGFPRTDVQARALDAMLSDLDISLDAVLLLAVPREPLMERLTGRWLCRDCGRSFHETFAPYAGADEDPCPSSGGACNLYQRDDDKADAIANRLDTYDAQTAPLIDYYRDAGLLREIDGDQPPEKVREQITKALA